MHSVKQQEPLSIAAEKTIRQYLSHMKEEHTTDFYQMVIDQIEPPLLEAVMEECHWNQVKAAKKLGMSRGTLRKKLVYYFDDRYCGVREN
jgi:Fis family transcriptional regulator, factor for inversion stimulation protein